MKIFIRIYTCFLLVFISVNSHGQGILNSHHDFTRESWSGNESCKPCHTPHNANTDVVDAPLWNHQLTSATFQVYSSSTLNSAPGQPTGHSKLCLSCHDGTVAFEDHSGNIGGSLFADWGNRTTDLRGGHPISFEYSSTLATVDTKLYDPESTPSGLGGTIKEDLLQNGNMECTSCHDVHLERNTQGCIGCHYYDNGPITVSLSLHKSNQGSALCLTCHIK